MDTERELVRHYGEMFRDYLALTDRFALQMKQLIEREQRLTGAESHALVFQLAGCLHECALPETIACTMADQLITRAAAYFAPPGLATLRIDASKFRHHWQREASNFNPERLWDALTTHYGGVNGHRAGYAQMAQCLIDRLEIKASDAPKIVAGAAVFSFSVTTETERGGARKLNFGTRESLTALLKAWSVFLCWAEEPSFDPHARCLEAPIISRERIPLSPGLDYLTYYAHFDFRLAHRLIEKLQIFLGQFAKEHWGLA